MFLNMIEMVLLYLLGMTFLALMISVFLKMEWYGRGFLDAVTRPNKARIHIHCRPALGSR